MDRLSFLDAEFLHLEDPSSPMGIASLGIFAGPVPSQADLVRLLEAKLPMLPRYRKRVRVPPGELGRPVWVDDPGFDVRNHLHFITLPPPADDAELDALMGRIMAEVLDRGRPLWDITIIDGLADGRWALVSKIHHSMVDGVSGVGLQRILLDARPDEPLPEIAPWAPEPEPSGLSLVLDAWRGLAQDAVADAGRALRLLRHPIVGARALRDTAEGLAVFVGRLLSLRTGPIQGKVGPHRSYAHATASLADVQAIRRALGGSVNDVVLAAISGGLRVLLAHRGVDPDRARLRSLVPVSVRGPDEERVPHNRVSAMLYDLPLDVADPVERLRKVSTQMGRLKASHMAEAGAWLVDLSELAPPMVAGRITRFVARAMHRVPQRMMATVTTNVPGPREPLYCLGRRMLEWRPYVPISQGLRVGTAILSYDGRLSFGVTGDGDTVPDAGVLARAIEDEIRALRSSAAA